MNARAALALGALLACLAASGCGDAAPATPAAPTGVDLLADPSRVVERTRPTHVLSPEIAALREREEVWTRDPPLPAAAWVPVDKIPPRWQALLERFPGRRLFRTRQPVRRSVTGAEPMLYADGARLPRLKDLEYPVPARVVWFEVNSDSLLAAAPELPDDVVVRRRARPADVLGPLHGDLAADDWTPRRYTLGEVSRPALLLPPPGRVVLDLGRLDAERVEFAVGRTRAELRLVDGDLVPAARGEPGPDVGAQGLRVALEVEADGAPAERVWSAELRRGDEPRWHEPVVDLAAYRGRQVRLHLVSEALGADAPAFELALWSSVRLRGGEPEPPARPHVVLVVLDTLRADALGAYGRQPTRTPLTDAWVAERGVVVSDTVSTATWTLPATTSLFTGLATHQHGVQRAVDVLPSAGPPTLAELLADAGYETRALTAGGYLRPAFGLDRGFDRYEVLQLRSAEWRPTLDWIAARDSSAPLFLLVHTYWVHAPWPWSERYVADDYAGPLRGVDVDYENVIQPFWDGEFPLDAEHDGPALRALYDALLADLDTHLGALLGELETQLGDEGLVLALTSDHGEAFLEHGVLGHGQALWQELLAVPLVFRRANGAPGRLDTPASLVDVAPTLLAEVGLPAPDGLPGRALFASGRVADLRVAQLDDTQRAVLSEGAKLVFGEHDDDPARLYDLAGDAAETRDLAAERPELVALLRERLDAWLAQHPRPTLSAAETAGLSEETLRELRQLGYLSDGDD